MAAGITRTAKIKSSIYTRISRHDSCRVRPIKYPLFLQIGLSGLEKLLYLIKEVLLIGGCDESVRRFTFYCVSELFASVLVLSWAVGPEDALWAQLLMLCCSAENAAAPESERPVLECFPHELNNICFRQIELCLDRVEGGAIFPSHFNDAGQFRRAEGLFVFAAVGHGAASVA